LQTTVFLAGDDGRNTADANDKKHYETEASVLKIAVWFVFKYMHDIKPILTKVHVVKMVNQAPKTIACDPRWYAPQHADANDKKHYETEASVLKIAVGVFYIHDLKPILTKVRVVKMVNEAPKTIASFARNRLRALRISFASCSKLMASESSPNGYVKNNLFGPPSSRSNPRPYENRGMFVFC
jgi:hypothetical protein